MGNLSKKRIPVERVEGAFLAAAIGDALGWPQEFNSGRIKGREKDTAGARRDFQPWRRRSGGRFYAHEEEISDGEYSDDTQLLLATARSLKYGNNWSRQFCRAELPLWLMYERGGGRSTKASAQSWLRGVPPWNGHENATQKYFRAGGNGVAMRILPHVFVGDQSIESLPTQVMLNGVLTHGHPRALVGALLYANAVWIAAHIEGPLKFGELYDLILKNAALWREIPRWERGFEEWLRAAQTSFRGEYLEEWKLAAEEVQDGLQYCQAAMHKGALAIDQDVLSHLGCFDRSKNGAGTVTALASVYLASRYAADPVTGMLEAAFAQGADTDTMASMMGGLLGTIRGTEWIPQEWKSVQDANYLRTTAKSLNNNGSNGTTGNPIEPWTVQRNNEALSLLSQQEAQEIRLGPLGLTKVIDVIFPRPLVKSISVRSWKLISDEGLSIYVKRINRETSEKEFERKPDEENQGDKSGIDIRRSLSLFERLSAHSLETVSAKQGFNMAAEILRVIDRESRKSSTFLLSNLKDEEHIVDLILREKPQYRFPEANLNSLRLLVKVIAEQLLESDE